MSQKSFLDEIRYIFSQKYQDDIRRLKFDEKMKPYVKLKGNSESIDVAISRLKEIGYKSNCSIKIGDFDDKNQTLSLKRKN